MAAASRRGLLGGGQRRRRRGRPGCAVAPAAARVRSARATSVTAGRAPRCLALWPLLIALLTPPGARSWGEQSQGPVFIQEPPHRADFSNSTGTSVLCSAHGNPPPTINWVLPDGSGVRDVPGLRKILPNGTLVFPPFPAEDYRPDVHSAMYRCVASNGVGTIVSRRVHVRAVVKQYYEVQVYDEYVILGNTAVLKCHIPSFVKEYVVVTAWLRGVDEEIVTDISTGGRYSVFPSGELHVRGVTHADGLHSYRCQTRHLLTSEQRLSVVAGKVIVTDPQSSVPPRVTDSRSLLQARQKETLELPCAAQGFPLPSYTWLRGRGGRSVPVQLGGRITQVGGSLFLESAQVEDSGRYTCVVNNSVGSERVHTTLVVSAPLSAYISPQSQVVDVGKPAGLNCTTEGHPQVGVAWLKDGRPLTAGGRIQLPQPQLLRLAAVERSDRGMYQCVVSNSDETAQGTAQLRLGDAAPIFVSTFVNQTMDPGPAWFASCEASGSPPPTIGWLLDGAPLAPDSTRSVSGRAAADSVLGYVNVTSVGAEDAGVYECVASNAVGSASHAAELRVRGPPFVKPMSQRSVVAGKRAVFHCRVAGHPISEIRWEKEGRTLPENHRQLVFQNGTLVIKDVQKKTDEGGYVCVATNPAGLAARGKLNVKVMEAPEIDPFSVKPNLQRGMRMHLTCFVSKGDFPISIRWLKNGVDIPRDSGVTQRAIDEYSSTLTFPALTESHTGNYTCEAANAAAVTSHTAAVVVNVPPSWVAEPTDAEVAMGGSVTLPCSAEGSPPPTVHWKKESGPSPSPYQDLSQVMANYKLMPNGTLRVENTRPEDRGYYLCQATSAVGTELSKVVYLTVHVPARFPVTLQNTTAARGASATLECRAEGDKPMTIAWFREERRLETRHHPRFAVAEETEAWGVVSRLTVRRAHRSDSALFACVATNRWGSDRGERALLVHEPPEPPRALRAVALSGRAANLSWEPAHDGNSPVTAFIVQYKNVSGSWSPNVPYVVVSGDQTSCRLVGLQPARSYHVRVLAENSVGRSNASELLTLTAAEEIPGGAPLDVRVFSKNSGTVQVSWKPPEKHLHHGEIMGYYIGYRVSNSTEPFHYNTLEAVPGTELRSTLSGLRSFTEYSVLVQAYNRAGAGPRSPEHTLTTDEDVPSAPPVDVQCTALSSQTILVSWAQPPAGEINGILLGYKVVYRPIADWEDLSPHAEQTTHELKLELHGLDHFCNYSIEVRAYTRKGDGVASRPIFCRTQEDVPGEPSEIKALVMDEETILLSWRTPRRPNGRIRKYKVYMDSLDGVGLAKDEFDLPPEQTYYSITHLKLHHRYEFWVRAFTSVGEGEPSHRKVQAPASKVPARIASFSDHVITAWKEELRMGCRMVGHPTPERIWKLNNKIIKEDNRVHIIPDGTLVITSIQNSDAGNYSCFVKNVFDEDEIIYSVRVQESRNKGIPFAPNDFHIPSTTTSSITLMWKATSTAGNVVQGYYLHYKREFGEWEKIKIPPENTSYTLTALQCGARYQFYLQAFNQLGLGTPTLTLYSRTQGSAPISPKNGDLIRENSTSISLNLASWQDGGCPITSLVIEYKLKQQLDWTLVSNNVKFEQIEFLVLDLSPETWYTLRMTAHNSAGSTVATYDFVTLTYSGATIAPELIVHSSYGHTHFYNELSIIIPIVAGVAVIIVAIVGGLVYLKRKKTMYPANKYGEKNAGTDMTSETALMSELEKKSCAMGSGAASSAAGCSIGGGDTHIPISPRDSAYLPTPMRVSLGRREDISPYATFRLPVPGGENPRMSVGEGIEPDISSDIPHHGQPVHSQQCDKLQQLPSSYGSCADSLYTKIRKKPQYQNEGVSNTKKVLTAEGTDRLQKVYNKASSSPQYSSPAAKSSCDIQQGAQSSSVTSVSSTHDELAKAFNGSFKSSLSHSTLASGRHNVTVVQSASEHGTTDTDAADTSICKFSPSSLKTFNLMMSSYLKPEPEYECVRDLLRGQCVRAESSTSLEGSSDEGLHMPCPQPDYCYTRPVRVPKHYYSSTESNSEDAVYARQQTSLEDPSTKQNKALRGTHLQSDQVMNPSWRILEYASSKYKQQRREYLLDREFNPAVLFTQLGDRTWGLPNI